MREIDNGKPTRIHARGWFCALALGCFSLTAHAQNNQTATRLSLNNLFSSSPGLTHIPVQGGGSVSLAQVSGGNVSTRIPLTLSTAHTGPVMNGVLRAMPGATLGTIQITAGARLPTGLGIPATVAVPVDGKDVGKALRNFAKRALPVVSTALALKELIDEVGLIPPDTPDGEWKKKTQVQTVPTNTTVWSVTGTYNGQNSTRVTITDVESPQIACQRFADGLDNYDFRAPWTGTFAGGGCQMRGANNQSLGNYGNPTSRVISVSGTEERIDPASDADVDQLVSEAPINRMGPFLEEIIRQGEDVPAKSEPQLSGPSSVTNPTPTTTTTTGPNGQPQTTTTQQQRTNVTYNGNTYNTTTTNITNTTNNTTNETTTTTTENPEESDLCKNNPDILACSKPELDTPDEEIPRRNFAVTFAAESLFGGGSCPANKTMNLRGQQITVWDFQRTCDLVTTYLKPLLLTLALFSAFLILSPGKDA